MKEIAIITYYYMGFSSRYVLMAFFVLNLCSKIVGADPNLAFSFKNFGKESNFESQIDLFGDAKVANGSTSVQVAGGRLICKKPFNLVDRKSKNMVSFSNNFVFSMYSENEDALAFVMLPAGFPLNVFGGGSMEMLKERKSKFLGVEFGVNSNHVVLEVLISAKVSNISSINLVLKSGEKLQAWIDYDAGSKKLEVRLSKYGGNRPINQLLAYTMDLGKMWKGENTTVGFISSTGNSSQKVNLYSWSFESRTVPNWMHSEALDPEEFEDKVEEMKARKRSNCDVRLDAALVLGSGCGVLVVLAALFMWTVFGNRRSVVPEEFAMQFTEFEFKKFNVSADYKAMETAK